jgi:hypothetical protein
VVCHRGAENSALASLVHDRRSCGGVAANVIPQQHEKALRRDGQDAPTGELHASEPDPGRPSAFGGLEVHIAITTYDAMSHVEP